MNDKLALLLFLILIFNSQQQCADDEILINIDKCFSLETLIWNSTVELDFTDINFLTRTLKTVSKNGYNIDFIRLDNKNLQSKNILKSKIYISKTCINLIEGKLEINDTDVGMVIIISNSNEKTKNGLPQTYFIIRYTGSDEQKYLNSTTYDFSFCNEDPILLNNSINIDQIQVFKKKQKTNVKEKDSYDLYKLNIERVMYAKKKDIDLFDLHSEFFEDICFKFTSEKNSDVTLETRLSDYYQNITLCNNKQNAHYIGFNYSKTNNTLYYTCAYGFYKNIKEKKSYIDEINDKMNIVFSNSNFKVITCYKEIIKYKEIYKNYGELLCIFVFFMQLIFLLTYCCQGTAPLKNQINKLLNSANKVPIIPSEYLQINKDSNVNQNNNQDNINNNNQNNINENNNQEKTNTNNIQNNNNNQNNNINNISNSSNKKNNLISSVSNINDISSNLDAQSKNEIIISKRSNETLIKKSNKKKTKNIKNQQNPPKKEKRKSLILDSKSKKLALEDIDKNDVIEEENIESRKKKIRKSVNISQNHGGLILNNEKNKDDKSDAIKNDENLEKKKIEFEKEAKEEKEEQIKRQKIIQRRRSSQIFAFDNDDLNELNFDEAKVFDKRHFCKYYCFMIQLSNILINTFCRCSDYNLFIIKFGLLLFTFPINLTFNAFFFTSSQIQSVYINKISDISIDWKNLVRSFASSILSSIILIFLKLLCLTHSSIRKLKKESNVEEANKKSISILNCIKVRIYIYYIFSLIFILLFGFYVSCFCAIFENTQIVLMQSMAISWFLSLLYPFGICFVTTIFRRGALTCGKKGRGLSFCYKINKILQLI